MYMMGLKWRCHNDSLVPIL